MKWDKDNPMVPFSENGNLAHYPSYRDEFVPGTPFTAHMRFIGFQRGRSAAYALFEREDGRRYPMFLTDLQKLLLSGKAVSGEYLWSYTKRGQTYGIKANV